MNELEFLGPISHHRWAIFLLAVLVGAYLFTNHAINQCARTLLGLRSGIAISSIILVLVLGYLSLEYLFISIRQENNFQQKVVDKRTFVKERVIKIKYRDR